MPVKHVCKGMTGTANLVLLKTAQARQCHERLLLAFRLVKISKISGEEEINWLVLILFVSLCLCVSHK